MNSELLLRTPLYHEHLASKARMVPFAGYEMPVQYASIIAESKAVRSHAGMFDVSHMARLELRGDKVIEFLEQVTSNDISKLSDGKGQYSLLPNLNGGCVDDIIVYRIQPNHFRMVVNASNHPKDVAWLNEQNTFGVEIEDITEQTAMIAVQGPATRAILAKASAHPQVVESAELFQWIESELFGIPCHLPCSGYTGEDGFELICNSDDAAELWKKLLGVGVEACGLGSRDTLRVEAGLPLYGHELEENLSPIAAGLGWVISKTKSFNSSDIFNAERIDGTPLKLQGVKLESKRLIAPGMKVYVAGKEVGAVTSGVVSPELDCGIAMAFVDASLKLGTTCTIEVRGKHEPGTLVSKRFWKRSS